MNILMLKILISALTIAVCVFGMAFLMGNESARGGTLQEQENFGLVIHGGAGTITRANMTEEREREYRAKLTEALQAGYEILNDGGTSLDAVVAAILILEDSPLFNAGRGAVFTSKETVELDASIMDGRTLDAGAVAAVKHAKNPIQLARLVMEQSPHVMLVGDGAESFGRQHDIEWVENEYFHTRDRLDALRRARERIPEGAVLSESEADRRGTVGAAALDRAGNLAAGTSTGGMTNKRFGRVGDSPIIGAGTYASNATCAISATGHGEYFIRSVVAHDISALMEYRGMSLEDASDYVINQKLVERGGSGGIIAIDRDGNVAMPFNTEGMYRGYVKADGEIVVEIYGD